MSGELPDGWTSAQIGELAQINPRHPKELGDSVAVSFVPMAAVSESKPEFSFLHERPLGKVRLGFTHFAEGDVLFAKITPCMENGKGAVATGLRNRLGCGTTELIVLRPLGGIDSHFAYRFLSQPSVRSEAKEHFTSTAGQARVPTRFIEELEIPVPPLAEQRRIVRKLRQLLGEVDACQQRLAKVYVLLQRFRQSVLAAACSGRLTADWREDNPDALGAAAAVQQIDEIRRRAAAVRRPFTSVDVLQADDRPQNDIPQSWEWVRFGSVIGELRNGISPRPNMKPPGTPVLRISAARPGRVDLTDIRYMPNGSEFVPTFAVRDDDLLFTRYNGSIELLGVCGRVRALGRKTLLYPDKLMRVRFDHDMILPAYAELFFQVQDVHERIVAKSKSSAGQNGVSGKDIKAQPFALPPILEQQEIVRRVEALFSLADPIEARLDQAQAQVDRLAPSLLAKAFRGELVPTEAELARQDGRDYEPASVLLERLQRERAGNAPQSKSSLRTKKSGRRAASAGRAVMSR